MLIVISDHAVKLKAVLLKRTVADDFVSVKKSHNCSVARTSSIANGLYDDC